MLPSHILCIENLRLRNKPFPSPLLTHRESFSDHNFCRAICLVSHKLSLKSLVIFFDRIAIRDHRTLQLAPDYYYNKVDKWCFICFTTCMKCAFDSPQQTLPYFKQTKTFPTNKNTIPNWKLYFMQLFALAFYSTELSARKVQSFQLKLDIGISYNLYNTI